MDRRSFVQLALAALPNDRSGFPCYQQATFPTCSCLLRSANTMLGEIFPTHVRTPNGRWMAVFGEDLAAEVDCRCAAPVQMMHFRQGIFDEGTISVIASER